MTKMKTELVAINRYLGQLKATLKSSARPPEAGAKSRYFVKAYVIKLVPLWRQELDWAARLGVGKQQAEWVWGHPVLGWLAKVLYISLAKYNATLKVHT